MVLVAWLASDQNLPSGRIYAQTCFEPFGDAVSDARRAGDRDPDQAIIADTMKLVGNSCYGKTITNKERHHKVQYCFTIKACQQVNEPYFCALSPIDNDTFEVEPCKKTHQTQPAFTHRLLCVPECKTSDVTVLLRLHRQIPRS